MSADGVGPSRGSRCAGEPESGGLWGSDSGPLYNIAGVMVFRVIANMSETYPFLGLPPAQGLYHPQHEHDACGIGFVANIEGQKSHDIVLKGIQILINLTHRGACGCDPQTGDGAGILIQIPHTFFERECTRLGFRCRRPANTAWAWSFLPVDRQERMLCEGILEKIASEEGLTVLGWRDTPINGNTIGRLARNSQPYIEQIFIRRAPGMDQDALERKLYVVRKRAEAAVAESDLKEKEFLLHPVAFLAHDRLQGPAAGAADHRLLQGTARSGSDQRAVPGAPALFDQHISELAAGASLSLHLPQRRNQHAARQRELDVRAAVRAGFSAVRRRHQEAAADHHAGRQRFGHARQRRGVADAGRPQPAARDVHADSRGVGPRSPPCRRTSRHSTNITPR